jgi:hypothetical protein
MKKIILEWVANFLLTRFGLSVERTESVSVLTEDQLSELLEALNKEFKVNINPSDIESFITRFGKVTFADLAAIVFAKCI